MNKWLILVLGIISILLLSYLSFKQKAAIIKEDLLKKADVLHENPAFRDVYIKIKGDGLSITRELMLLGSVSTKKDIELASNILKDIDGVSKVNNLLKVQTSKPIIKEVESIDENNTPNEPAQKEENITTTEDKNSSSTESNSTQIILEESNISKEENITEINSTKQELIESLDSNLTEENKETNQSSCQEQLNNILAKSKIHFAHNSSNIEKNSYKELDKISTIIKECSPTLIEINGYTDNSGNARYNKHLSQLRAKKIKAYLESKGIDKDSIKAFGYGAQNPIAPNTTKEGREKNRRIEFSIKGTK